MTAIVSPTMATNGNSAASSTIPDHLLDQGQSSDDMDVEPSHSQHGNNNDSSNPLDKEGIPPSSGKGMSPRRPSTHHSSLPHVYHTPDTHMLTRDCSHPQTVRLSADTPTHRRLFKQPCLRLLSSNHRVLTPPAVETRA